MRAQRRRGPGGGPGARGRGGGALHRGRGARAAALGPFARRPAGTTLAANLTIVGGMGGSPATLAADAAHAAALGADELRLYHAGLAGAADLEAVRGALRALNRSAGGRAQGSGAASVPLS
ncbi:hypothetical protein SALB_03237 [Streptomyces noursei]|uniref:Uncharacterized protein n=1 Tax=Streptomyces noursei TaxID=1971 RepID=A0A401QYS3_STRNR|nr:hypothetical protein SALB_03237 [Streptomyces noursei]